MPEEIVVTPDLAFIRELQGAGADTLKKCYQCATCSVVCPISPDNKPFPRKEMVMAQWGMKEELAADPDIWLCHNCNDCTKYCPRGAKPGDVLSVLRKRSIQENAVPGFMGKLVGEPKFTFVALSIPVVLFLIILGALGHLHIPEGEIVYAKFFPIPAIDSIFITATVLVAAAFFVSLSRFIQQMNARQGQSITLGGLVPSLVPTIKEILAHTRFKKCGPNKDRSTSHLLVFYGFIALAITTSWAVFYLYGFNILFGEPYEGPYPITDPVKWVGTAGAVALLLGALLVIINRVKDKGFETTNSSSDWTFAIIVFVLGLTGILSWVLRLADIPAVAYPVYFIHLVFVFYTIAYLPYSKLAHMVYRTVAIAYAKQMKRDIEL
ncbi:MAG: quinone-interacting membrane-bound oxidoreductase complex subunit QmoC [bacterium]